VDFGATTAVRDVSFELNFGEVLTIVGPNGAGKTTSLTTLLGFRRPTAGLVELHGLNPVAHLAHVSESTGAMLQDGGVWAPMTPAQVIDLTASYYRHPRSGAELIDRLALGSVATTPWRRLSGGEKQRTLLALALLGQPSVLILDEPTSGVDPEGRDVIRELIREEKALGRAIVVTTHELDEAERISDRVCVIAQGRTILSGQLAELTRSAELVIHTDADLSSAGEPPRGGHITGSSVRGPANDADFLARATAWLADRQVNVQSISSTHSLDSIYRHALEGEAQ
jgi:ABC-2 type transport system ATP-binding protein